MASDQRKDEIVDGLLYGDFSDFNNLPNWHHVKGGVLGAPVTLNYCFVSDFPAYYSPEDIAAFSIANPAILSTGAQNAVRDAFGLWRNVADVSFNQVTDPNDADISIGYADFVGSTNSDWAGLTRRPPNSSQVSDKTHGDIWFNSLKGTSNFENAANNPRFFRVLVHEIGPGPYPS